MTTVVVPTSTAADTARARSLQRLLLRRTLRAPWRHLPGLAVGGAVTALATGAALRLAAPLPEVFTPALVAPVLGATLTPLLAVAQDALVEDDTELRRYPGNVHRHALRGAGLMLLLGVPLTAALSALAVYQQTGHSVVLVSLSCAIMATVLAGIGLLAVLPASVARPGLRGWRLWSTGWHLVGRWPIRFLAAAVTIAAMTWLAMSIASSLVLLLAIPAALVMCAAFWCCAIDLGADDVWVAPDGGV